jgi:hypothetical protein
VRRALISALLIVCLAAAAADARTYVVKPGPAADAEAQAAFASARSGDTIRFGEGRFALTRPLALKANKVDIRGKGAGKTILSFSGMIGEGDAVRVSGDELLVRDLAVEDAKGAALVAGGGDITIESVAARRALGPGIALVGARNAVIHNCLAQDALVGFSVENSAHVDLMDDIATGNATGVVIVDRPGAAAGGPVRVLRAKITANNGQGIGIDVIGVKDVGLLENEIGEHGTANILVRASDAISDDPAFVAIPSNITIARNKFGRAGFAPAHDWAPAIANGAVFGDIVWDGARSWVAAGRPQTAPVLFAIEGNVGLAGAAPRFLSLGLEVAGAPASEAAPSAAWPPLAHFAAPETAKLR